MSHLMILNILIYICFSIFSILFLIIIYGFLFINTYNFLYIYIYKPFYFFNRKSMAKKPV